MLQKLENIYLTILRAVVIITSGIVLLFALIFSLAALKGLAGGAGGTVAAPEVSADTIITRMTTPESADEAQRWQYGTADEYDAPNPNQPHYAAAAAAIARFVTEASGGTLQINQPYIAEHLKHRAEMYDSEDFAAAYAKGITATAREMTGNETIAPLVNRTSAGDVVDQMINIFTTQFEADLNAEYERASEAREAQAQAKADAANSLYLAGASFALFLLIVFLSIFIKIERNLRHIEPKTAV